MLEFLNHPVPFTSFGLSSELFSIGPFALRWYALAYIAGILLAWAYVARMLRLPGRPAEPRHIDDLVTWATVGIILGGRLAWLIFYADWHELGANPLMALEIWHGGMSFHGGMVGVGLAILLYARNHGLDGWRVVDYVATAAPIGLFLGRLANFVNGELWGRPTDGSWGIIFPKDPLGAPRHPSQLYEAGLEGIALFLILGAVFWLTRARLRSGLIAGLFLLLYGVFRYGVEFVREPDVGVAILWGFTRGQLLCLPMIAGGLVLIARGLMQRPAPALPADEPAPAAA
jgi:phosphatidylglycerol:prolipoprotein diacylglycerol transferase